MQYAVVRWAVARRGVLLSKHHWDDLTDDEPLIRTFGTREAARKAAKRTRYNHAGLVPVKVELTITEVSG
jgi:hypothetical protein